MTGRERAAGAGLDSGRAPRYNVGMNAAELPELARPAEVRALTLRAPWAWAVLHAGKRVENRSRPWRYRGPS